MLPEFALHHLPLYATLACASGGLLAWTWARAVTSRQRQGDRREAIAEQARRVERRPRVRRLTSPEAAGGGGARRAAVAMRRQRP